MWIRNENSETAVLFKVWNLSEDLCKCQPHSLLTHVYSTSSSFFIPNVFPGALHEPIFYSEKYFLL